ncbi:MAG: hypothetical protein AB1689_29315, partial [Thermodesulfobacteriota bacterium]
MRSRTCTPRSLAAGSRLAAVGATAVGVCERIDGIAIEVTDATGASAARAFGPANCTIAASGAIRCQSPDGRRSARLEPLGGTPGLWRVKAR